MNVLSVLSVEPYGMKPKRGLPNTCSVCLSVLSVEPYGMKHDGPFTCPSCSGAFSALGRAVWDETRVGFAQVDADVPLSVLSVEPYGMKQHLAPSLGPGRVAAFSALGRAVWDETESRDMLWNLLDTFSALGRAVWDETNLPDADTTYSHVFQCSRSSRMG